MKDSFTIVRNTVGAEVLVKSWATFTREIGGKNVSFKVTTRIGGKTNVLVVTHTQTGFKCCDVPWSDVVLTRFNEQTNDYKKAGERALARKMQNITASDFQNALVKAWAKVEIPF